MKGEGQTFEGQTLPELGDNGVEIKAGNFEPPPIIEPIEPETQSVESPNIPEVTRQPLSIEDAPLKSPELAEPIKIIDVIGNDDSKAEAEDLEAQIVDIVNQNNNGDSSHVWIV